MAQDTNAPDQAIARLVEQLRTAMVSDERAQAAHALGKIADPDAVPELVRALTEDPEMMVRVHAANALGEIGDPAGVRHLKRAIEEDSNPSVRQTAVRVLADMHVSELLPFVAKVLNQDENRTVRMCAAMAVGRLVGIALDQKAHDLVGSIVVDLVQSLRQQDSGVRVIVSPVLGRIGQPRALEGLFLVLAEEDDAVARLAAANAIERIGPTIEYAPQLLRALRQDSFDHVKKAVAGALALLGDAELITPLEKDLASDSSTVTRNLAAQVLGSLQNIEAVPSLSKALLVDDSRIVRDGCARALQKIGTWRDRADHILHCLAHGEYERLSIEPDLIVLAISPSPDLLREDPDLLTDYLFHRARFQDERMTSLLASVLIAAVHGDIAEIGRRLNRYQTANEIPSQEFTQLRVEIGGATALDPVFQTLRANLETSFHGPIVRLNEDTHSMWQKTIRYAQYGFVVRVVMSIVVFIVGVVLISVSGYRIIFGDLAKEQLLGPGISFGSGLGTILLVVYTGPLQQIRQSVNDLGIASTSFIAYIHRILQISHTFSYSYLNQQINLDGISGYAKLIDDAMKSTVDSLQQAESRSVADDGT